MFWTEGRKEHQGDHEEPVDSHSHSHSNGASNKQQHHEEQVSILQDTYDELEKERAKRRELEAKIAQLEKQNQKQQQSTTSTRRKSATAQKAAVSNKRLVALQAEMEGYRQIVDALTMGRPAIDAAVAGLRSSSTTNNNNSNNTPSLASTSILVNPQKPLPLHIVRFLEVMPWHPQAMEAAVVTEELYEWQAYSAEKKAWKSDVEFFTTFFNALPVVIPGDEQPTKEQSKETRKPGVWTNKTLTLRFDLRNGCVLPNKRGVPSWKWIGGWQVQKDTTNDDTTATATCTSSSFVDQDGWMYAKESGHFLLADSSSYADVLIPPASLTQQVLSTMSSSKSAATTTKKKKKHRQQQPGPSPVVVRRRKWSRERVLVDYPHASENTIHYLKLLANREELKVTNALLKDSYNDAQQALADMEVHNAAAQFQWTQERRALEARLETVQQEHKEHLEVLERTRGPSKQLFASHSPLPKVIYKRLNDDDESDSDSDDDTDCSSDDDDEEHDTNKSRPASMLLHPEDGTIDLRAAGAEKPQPRRSFFGWGAGSQHKEHGGVSPSTAPDVEPCSDDNSISTYDHDVDVSEQSTDDDASLAIFSSSPPSEDRHKSFLHMWFGKHEDDEHNKTTAGTGLGDAQEV
ncbi:expressed unknown protein [Seminavis robusta]|uniref:Uncharacterized protein n=1 Tax=Seminavis robusta TaxID=568900 RepID=A0A9N8H6D6_9STRA|nr:expressed unknown protein [Seminavis robusta]|eukprot:Sro97_g050040.1 n/a (633) ;mRNA; r:70461-72359